IGTFCWIGWADIGDDVMLGGHDVILSGGRHHGFDDLERPIREQQGEPVQIKIGDGAWIGNGAIIMADVAPGSVVGAGAVVTRTFEPNAVLAGVPARVIRWRGQTMPDDSESDESQAGKLGQY
ncbi:MAG: acyltransferase, partial [Anaerolineae bacterium]|nr:acyltransferase [Anaerolineae bacterium]